MSAPTTLVSAVPVPFEANGDLDVKGQETLLRHLKDAGIGGVFIAGTTGEFTALDADERAIVLSAALEVYGADAVYVHVGAAAARQAERLTAQAITLGARRLAAITPFYLPAGPAALIDYYRRLDAVAGNARIYVYLFAARTGSVVTPDQLAELATIPSVAGAKISGEANSAVLQYVQAVPDDFEVYSGNDIEFGDFVRAGGTGAVSGVSSVFPRPFLDLANALRRSDDQAATVAQEHIKQAVDAANGADIALIKAGLSLQGLPAGPTRVALDQPTPAQLETLRTAIQELT
ncbi:MAG: 4-hydroxy-tetrahydrodipicolinate synthase [Mycobacterium sp.]|jgi:4-hydroxy-tetrahydrodipicolinate synthase|nr:4-hydroxy-tetrahydrodipicolinate synthase [Mycobacterium sp.]